MRLRAIIWDYGNTLATMDLATAASLGGATSAEALHAVEREHRRALDEHLRLALRDGTAPRTLRFILNDLFSRANVPLSPHALDAIVRENRRWSLWRILNPDAREVLDALRGLGVELAVVSNGDGHVTEHLGTLGVLDRFNVVVDSAVIGHSKPAPEIFQVCLTQLGLRASEAAYIGDLPCVDVLGAARAGLLPILYDPLNAFDGTECPPHHANVIRSLHELIPFVAARR